MNGPSQQFVPVDSDPWRKAPLTSGPARDTGLDPRRWSQAVVNAILGDELYTLVTLTDRAGSTVCSKLALRPEDWSPDGDGLFPNVFLPVYMRQVWLYLAPDKLSVASICDALDSGHLRGILSARARHVPPAVIGFLLSVMYITVVASKRSYLQHLVRQASETLSYLSTQKSPRLQTKCPSFPLGSIVHAMLSRRLSFDSYSPNLHQLELSLACELNVLCESARLRLASASAVRVIRHRRDRRQANRSANQARIDSDEDHDLGSDTDANDSLAQLKAIGANELLRRVQNDARLSIKRCMRLRNLAEPLGQAFLAWLCKPPIEECSPAIPDAFAERLVTLCERGLLEGWYWHSDPSLVLLSSSVCTLLDRWLGRPHPLTPPSRPDASPQQLLQVQLRKVEIIRHLIAIVSQILDRMPLNRNRAIPRHKKRPVPYAQLLSVLVHASAQVDEADPLNGSGLCSSGKHLLARPDVLTHAPSLRCMVNAVTRLAHTSLRGDSTDLWLKCVAGGPFPSVIATNNNASPFASLEALRVSINGAPLSHQGDATFKHGPASLLALAQIGAACGQLPLDEKEWDVLCSALISDHPLPGQVALAAGVASTASKWNGELESWLSWILFDPEGNISAAQAIDVPLRVFGALMLSTCGSSLTRDINPDYLVNYVDILTECLFCTSLPVGDLFMSARNGASFNGPQTAVAVSTHRQSAMYRHAGALTRALMLFSAHPALPPEVLLSRLASHLGSVCMAVEDLIASDAAVTRQLAMVLGNLVPISLRHTTAVSVLLTSLTSRLEPDCLPDVDPIEVLSYISWQRTVATPLGEAAAHVLESTSISIAKTLGDQYGAGIASRMLSQLTHLLSNPAREYTRGSFYLRLIPIFVSDLESTEIREELLPLIISVIENKNHSTLPGYFSRAAHTALSGVVRTSNGDFLDLLPGHVSLCLAQRHARRYLDLSVRPIPTKRGLNSAEQAKLDMESQFSSAAVMAYAASQIARVAIDEAPITNGTAESRGWFRLPSVLAGVVTSSELSALPFILNQLAQVVHCTPAELQPKVLTLVRDVIDGTRDTVRRATCVEWLLNLAAEVASENELKTKGITSKL